MIVPFFSFSLFVNWNDWLGMIIPEYVDIYASYPVDPLLLLLLLFLFDDERFST